MPRITYKNWNAIEYAKKYCGKADNSCGVHLDEGKKSDCAHFLAHCLAAGGIGIKNVDPGTAFCPHGLAVRNTVIIAELKNFAKAYDNVREIDLSDAIVGDVGFLTHFRPWHAFMVCEPWNKFTSPLSTPKVYAHSTSRCCAEMDSDIWQWFATAFRLEDG